MTLLKKLGWLAIGICALMSSCGLIPAGSTANEALCPGTQVECGTSRPVARATLLFPSKGDETPPFVGLAISGGGSRAANFSLAVMEQLEKLGIMQHVTAISTTSGGGLSGAYYALNGSQMHGESGEKEWSIAKEKFGKDFRDRWLFKWVLPWNLAATSFTHRDRSDLMADIFNEQLFDKATYASLADPIAPYKPIWIANATEVATGTLFTFSDKVFERAGSPLDTFPIANAVVASAAFPGAFNSVTLKKYPLAPEVIMERLKALPESYIHLMDGGPADNLGVESLLTLFASTARMEGDAQRQFGRAPEQQRSERTMPPCLLIIVDAYPEGVPGKNTYEPDPRSWKDHFIDFNFVSAFDSFLKRRRNEFLDQVGLFSSKGTMGSVVPIYSTTHNFPSVYSSPKNSVTDMVFPLQFNEGQVTSMSVLARNAASCKGSVEPACQPGKNAVCTIWHIALDNIASIPVYRLDDMGAWRPVKVTGPGQEDDAAFAYRNKLRMVVSQIDTDFKLAGPRGCSSDFLQNALYAAARVTTQEDLDHRRAVCKWFTDHHLEVSNACAIPIAPLSDNEFPISVHAAATPIASPNSELARQRESLTKRPRDESVACE